MKVKEEIELMHGIMKRVKGLVMPGDTVLERVNELEMRRESQSDMPVLSRNLKTVFSYLCLCVKQYLLSGIISGNKNKCLSFIMLKQEGNQRSAFSFMVPFCNFYFCELLWDSDLSLVKHHISSAHLFFILNCIF